jgi:hypothetical protein
MRNPAFNPAERNDQPLRKPEKDIRKILRESDDRARKLFERYDAEREDEAYNRTDNPKESDQE